MPLFRNRAWTTWLRGIFTDLRHAFRALRRSSAFSFLVVLTLAIGMGAATAVFSVVDAVLLRPPSYPAAHRLVELNIPERGSPGLDVARWEAWSEAGVELVEAWAAFTPRTVTRVDGSVAERLSALAVTPGTDGLAGIGVLLGRTLTDEDARTGAPVALMTERYWDRRGRDPDVLGSVIGLDTGPVTVVGVLAGGTKVPEYGDGQDLWLPIHDDLTALGVGVDRFSGVWGRLREGLTVSAAQEQADRVAESLQEAAPREQGWEVALEPVASFRANREPARALWLLFGTVGMILGVSLLNGANLVGIRTLSRSREVSIRAAVGASRGRLLRQLLAESLLLGLLAGTAALGLAWLSLRGMEGLVPSDITYFSIHELGIEERTLTFAFLSSLVAGVVLGLLPGVTVARRSLRAGMGAGKGDTGDSLAQRWIRRLLVVGQTALSTVLLVGAVLFVSSFTRLVRVDPGFEHERLVEGVVGLSPSRLPEEADRAAFVSRLERELENRAVVEAVTVTGGPAGYNGVPETEAGPVGEEQDMHLPSKRVAPDYLEVMGTELVRGRGFEPGDRGRNVTVVDRDLAHLLWGMDDVVGRRFRVGEEPWLEVVGVARDLRLRGRDQGEQPYQLLVPRDPTPWTYVEIRARARPGQEAASLLPVMRSALADVDREQTFFRLRTAGAALAEQEQTTRFLALLMAILGGIAVTTAAVGVFGVLAYSVRRRRREMGVRQAVGAGAARILRLVVGDGLALGATGVALGTAGALALAGRTEDLLFGVSPRDPGLLATSAVFFLAVVGAASLLPALRAVAVDPVETLRAE